MASDQPNLPERIDPAEAFPEAETFNSSYDAFEPAETIDLSCFDEAYEAAAEYQTGPVPDGKYRARIVSVQLVRNRNDNPMFKWHLVVTEGPHQGRHLYKNIVVTNATLRRIKTDLRLVGISVPIGQAPDHFDGISGTILDIAVERRGDFVNVYFNRVVATPESGAASDDTASSTPF